MSKKLIWRNLVYGLLSWIIPFAVSFVFYKPGGELAVPYSTFKTIIMIVGTISGCYLLYRYFLIVEADYIRNGIFTGVLWFSMNLVLDVAFLLPMMKTTFAGYFMSIGMGYVAIPVIALTMGSLLTYKLERGQDD